MQPLPHIPTTEGIYHKVEKGQTLWGISKLYSIELDTLAKINHIRDVRDIEIGQLLFIPRYAKKDPNQKCLSEEFIWPLKGKVVSSFGQKNESVLNKGIDIHPTSTEICASRSGQVVFYAPNFRRFGMTIILDHKDGFFTVYSGLDEALVKLGDNVSRGTKIANMRHSSTAQNNSLLHFEIRKETVPLNPYFFLSD